MEYDEFLRMVRAMHEGTLRERSNGPFRYPEGLSDDPLCEASFQQVVNDAGEELTELRLTTFSTHCAMEALLGEAVLMGPQQTIVLIGALLHALQHMEHVHTGARVALRVADTAMEVALEFQSLEVEK